MIIGTAGHIDHGKSTLVRALTGVDTDRLKEEKARGISIELGYAYLPAPDGQVLGFIDVPGHEKLVHTMVAGASGIDFGLLVIAADDGVMPQTREHLAILELVGVTRGAVALTKTDRVDIARVAEVESQVRSLLAGTALAEAPVFPVNAQAGPDGDDVVRLRDHLFACASALPERREGGFFRLAVDRVFTLAGHGTVVTGTVFSGRLDLTSMGRGTSSGGLPRDDQKDSPPGHHEAASLVLAPAGTPVRVRSLHAQNRAATVGVAGQRCALNLAGIDTRAIERGDWIADGRAMAPSARIDVDLRLLADADTTVKAWTPLHIHWGAARRLAHVVPLSADSIAPGASGRVQLVFDKPVCASAGDRFIARNAQATRTIGGGVVLDPQAPDRKRRSPARLAWLDAIEAMLSDGRLDAVLAQAPLGVRIADLQRLAGRPFEALALIDRAMPAAVPDDAVRATPSHADVSTTATHTAGSMATSDAAGPAMSSRVAASAVPALAAGTTESTPAAVPTMSSRLPTEALRIDDIVILRRHRDALRDAALVALRKFHDDLPDEPGADISRLRRMAWPTLDDGLLHALVDDLLRDGELQRNGPWLHLPGHSAALSEEDEALAQRLLPDLLAGAYDPPWVRDLARRHNQPEDRVRVLLRKLMRRGDVSQIVKDLFYHRDRVRELIALMARLAAGPVGAENALGGDVTQGVGVSPGTSVSRGASAGMRGIEAAAFRDATGLGRKRSIQILEFFDRVGYTRRVRDIHIPRADAQWDI